MTFKHGDRVEITGGTYKMTGKGSVGTVEGSNSVTSMVNFHKKDLKNAKGETKGTSWTWPIRNAYLKLHGQEPIDSKASLEAVIASAVNMIIGGGK